MFEFIDIQIRKKFELTIDGFCIKSGFRSPKGDFVQKFPFASIWKGEERSLFQIFQTQSKKKFEHKEKIFPHVQVFKLSYKDIRC